MWGQPPKPALSEVEGAIRLSLAWPCSPIQSCSCWTENQRCEFASDATNPSMSAMGFTPTIKLADNSNMAKPWSRPARNLGGSLGEI
jgi:hypothetical protein